MFFHHPSDAGIVAAERQARLRSALGDTGLRRRLAAWLISAGERISTEPTPARRASTRPAPASPFEGPQAPAGPQQAAVRA